MIPSVLAQQLQHGVEDFLRTTFPVSTPHFHGLVDRLLEEDGGIFKGPYVSLQLPFRQATTEGEFFENVPLGWRPFLHQEQAFERLESDTPRSTLVATGTGSGKTESFLVPILDYCYRHRDEPGIKAILIYPMNALANDQAGRIARMVCGNERLQGHIRAGLYVGQRDATPRRGMEAEGLITDRQMLRLDPPDILLTNYKMLDYLLVRPDDYPLWQHNDPETLRFMVVDELHTFDGAQGTDLACLIRRLQARVRTPEGHLCCVGTSATLGGERARNELREYAGLIFGQDFDRHAVIMESRQSDAEFLEGSYVRALAPPPSRRAGALDPATYDHHDDYLRAQLELWFGDELAVDDLDDPDWRVELGDLLKSHPLVRNVLTVLRGGVKSLDEVQRALVRATPELQGTDAAYRRHLFDSLLALVAAARAWTPESENERVAREAAGRPRPTRPLLELRIQLWLRELRRMVASVGQEPRLGFFDDLTEDLRRVHLPVIHCRDCGSTGWGAMRRPLDQVLDPDLQGFYQGFFSDHPNTTFVFPGEPEAAQGEEGMWCWIDRHMGLHDSKPEGAAVQVFLPDNSRRGQNNRQYTHHDCPFCGSGEALTILGSRAASLTSVLITQLYASSFNEHRKLIAFSDSVQDASHRAGFFAARTYRFNIRSAIQQFVDAAEDRLTLEELPGALARHFRTLWSENEYLAHFIAPDMMWLKDYDTLISEGRLPRDSNLPELVDRRIAWEIFSEYGYRARIGRTLEKSGGSIAQVDPQLLDRTAERLREVLHNELGGFGGLDTGTVRTFLVGLLAHLRTQGGVFHDALENFLTSGGNTYLLNRQIFMPGFAPRSRAPSFMTRTSHQRFDALNSGQTTSTRTWYEEWAEKCFSAVNPMVSGNLWEVYDQVLDVLCDTGLLKEHPANGTPVWGIPPRVLRIRRAVGQFRCGTCGHQTSGAEADSDAWEGAPCLRFRCSGHYQEGDDGALDYYGRLYATGVLERIIAREHTGLLEREEREELEANFIRRERPWDPNLLSCTPTLEMGIDIGDLSTVLLCSIPPAQANYIQRIGRAGRRDGNALNLAVANGRPHDLYFYAQPEEMIEGEIQPPGVFLKAAAVLERQMTAYCLDRWVETNLPPKAIPSRLRSVLDGLGKPENQGFPFNFLAFVEARQGELVDGFLALFGEALDQGAQAYVRSFVVDGGPDGRSLSYKLLDGLGALKREREGLGKTVDRIRRRIRSMEAQEVRDKNYDDELAQLKQERDALRRIIREKIDKRHTLNFLTDEGLIPNYAFPEAGVLLRSVIYRKIEAEGGSEYETRVYEYERPAVSAISELAPANRFYAEGRNVTIDRIDLTVADVETWRLCDTCAHSALQVEGDTPDSCPRCGSSQWSDSGQEHPMVKMRQVFASTSDRRSRTSDDSDERRPVFYKKQLLVDYDDASITRAFSLDDEELPFGFEFLARVDFREINFGEVSFEGPEVKVAGEEAPRKGFSICRHCGKVRDPRGETRHTISCPARGEDGPEHFIQALYLYRDFSSEAIRILLPETTFTGSERTLHSFIAALQLGLRRKFRGSIDHLRVTQYEEPIPDSPHRKRSLVLYDTVPGGTGYLKELMRSTEPLLQVFERALESLRSCPCNSDPDKDGCYRCLYAYRNSYDMADTSRDRAVELLSDVLKRKDRFQEVDSLRALPVNALFDSELEARFVQALKEAGSEKVPVDLAPLIVGRKPGYFVKVGEEAYYIEPQVELGESDHVALASRADFVLRPARGGATVKPIAVFVDGWAYHRDRIGRDLAQRMAIARSGRYLVWSLTWKDIEHALGGQGAHHEDLLAPGAEVPRMAGSRPGEPNMYRGLVDGFDPDHDTASLMDLPDQDSFTWLLRFLAAPERSIWGAHAAIQTLLHLDPEITRSTSNHERWKTVLADTFPAPVVDTVLDLDPELFGGWAPRSLPLRTFMAGRKEAAGTLDLDGFRIVCLLDDGEAAKGQPNFQRVWNGVLRFHNLMQFLPSALVLSTSGLEERLYDDLDLSAEAAGVGAVEEGVEAARWQEVGELSLPEAQSLVDAMAARGIPVPTVGYELPGRRGVVAGMAEFAWPDRKLALLDESQIEFTGVFEGKGWTVVSLEDAAADPSALLTRFSDE